MPKEELAEWMKQGAWSDPERLDRFEKAPQAEINRDIAELAEALKSTTSKNQEVASKWSRMLGRRRGGGRKRKTTKIKKKSKKRRSKKRKYKRKNTKRRN